ncbi:MAG TPA: acyl-CoA reductase [Polyangiaceae bacterium]
MSVAATRAAERRVRALVDGAALLADATSELGRRARRELVASTGLSPEGVELALAECLETRVTDAEVAEICARAVSVPAAHVLLSANIFVAAHRAVALALAASEHVRVRPSRREPAFARLLAGAAPGLFDVVAELAPASGDALWAYGSDETLHAVRATLPPGVAFHPHGSGVGVAVIDAAHATPVAARALALDVIPFDQRGCLSPRAVAFVGSPEEAHAFGSLVAAELATLAERVPLGLLASDEAADVTRFRDTLTVAGSVRRAGPGFVATTPGGRLVVAPVGRNLAITPCDDPVALLEPVVQGLAALGLAASDELEMRVPKAFAGARASPLGRMQRPAFDGPVDRRPLVRRPIG